MISPLLFALASWDKLLLPEQTRLWSYISVPSNVVLSLPGMSPLPPFTELLVPQDPTSSSHDLGRGQVLVFTALPMDPYAHTHMHTHGRGQGHMPAARRTAGHLSPGWTGINAITRLIIAGLYYAILFQLIIRGTIPHARSSVLYYFTWPTFRVHSRCSFA